MTPDTLLIGVDGGATACRAALRWAGKTEIVTAEAGSANATTDAVRARENIRAAIDAAAEKLGAGKADIAGATAHLGVAGVLDVADGERLSRGLGIARVAVTDDRHIHVTGALGGADGYVVAIGTGTIVARSRSGEVTGVGGWGFTLSDQGSGADLGRSVLRRAILCEDGLEVHTDLTRHCLAEFGGSARALASFAVGAGPADYARAAPAVIDAAVAGDVQARALLAKGSGYIDRALRTLGFTDGDRLCLTGGIGRYYEPYLDAAQRARLTSPVRSALASALELAEASWRAEEGVEAQA
ncbi:glucosamine kinase [Palleronia aestuarii]|uniref:Glucosamine kinase n=1 Tax=Palleronia aestuarii TaxID=568105 RepID=A0A2W7NDK9_9RHOB|nr:BadF/BadG/BcrA/BcrD ATPase family protein [Palleronia aestuarii]PZX16227.1 glucosamine kinase [Palleronia aestuarii]